MNQKKQEIKTAQAPAALGAYSQGVRIGNTVYLSGQIPLDPATLNVVPGGITAQIIQVFDNLKSVAEASGGNLDAIARLTIYLTDIRFLSEVNEIMTRYFTPPYPARTSIAVVALPKGVDVEVDGIMVLA